MFEKYDFLQHVVVSVDAIPPFQTLGDASIMLESIEGVIVSSCGALDAALRPPQIAQTQGNVIDSMIPDPFIK